MSTNTPQIDREALRRDGWQVIETEEEKKATACQKGDECLDEDGNWQESNNWRYSPFTFARWYTYRRRIPAPVEPAAAPASGWVAFSERKPTEADADPKGKVLVHDTEDGWTGAMELTSALASAFPYWIPIPPLPEPVKPKSQDDLDEEEALKHYTRTDDIGSTQREIFKHGLRAGRQSDSTRARGGKGAV